MTYVYLQTRTKKRSAGILLSTLKEVDKLSSTVYEVLEDIGYFDKPDRFDTRRIFQGYIRPVRYESERSPAYGKSF